MAEQTQQTCPYCGASLPAEASFCPRCARSVNQRQKVSPPSIRWRKALRRAFPALLLILILGAAGTGWYLSTLPQVYDDGGTGEVTYTDEDGTYQLLLGWLDTPYEPRPRHHPGSGAGRGVHLPRLPLHPPPGHRRQRRGDLSAEGGLRHGGI